MEPRLWEHLKRMHPEYEEVIINIFEEHKEKEDDSRTVVQRKVHRKAKRVHKPRVEKVSKSLGK
jgi:hypothetical protein